MIRDVAFEQEDAVIGDGQVATMGLDDDPLEQIVRDVDGPALDPLRGPGGRCSV
jgi:hypothetical protein